MNYGGIVPCIHIQKLKSEAISTVGVLFVIHLAEGNDLDEQLLFPPQCKCIFWQYPSKTILVYQAGKWIVWDMLFMLLVQQQTQRVQDAAIDLLIQLVLASKL